MLCIIHQVFRSREPQTYRKGHGLAGLCNHGQTKPPLSIVGGSHAFGPAGDQRKVVQEPLISCNRPTRKGQHSFNLCKPMHGHKPHCPRGRFVQRVSSPSVRRSARCSRRRKAAGSAMRCRSCRNSARRRGSASFPLLLSQLVCRVSFLDIKLL
jgi:hypothetical protein